jgi:predicted nucleic acid-binding protein
MAVVVDASAVAAIVFGEAGAERIQQELAGQTLYAPRLIDYELANVAWKKLRRTPAAAVDILDMLAGVDRLNLTHSHPDMVQVLALAVATGLTPYDASYLWLCQTLGLPLITLDRALARAAAAL